jgi:signal transduction histidine kinase
MMEDQSARIKALLNKIYPLKMFTDLQKDAIVSHAVIRSVEDGGMLYKEGDPANEMFLILYGAIRLALPVDEDDPKAGVEPLGDLEPGDLVGLEALEQENEYLTRALAVGTAKVACLNMEFLDPLLEDNAILYQVIDLMLDSLKLFLEIDLPWRNPEEAVIFIARRHDTFMLFRMAAPFTIFILSIAVLLFLIVFNPAGGLVIGIAAGIAALLSGLWSIWNYVDWMNDYAILTNERAVFQERVVALYDSRLETPLDAILSTSIDTTQLGRILGHGEVIMKTYTGTLIFPDLAMWETVRQLVDDRRARARETSVQAEKQALQAMVRQRLRLAAPQASAAKPATQPAEESGSVLGRLLSKIFQMRIEKGSEISYRTHWFLLLKNLFFPVVVFLGLMVSVGVYLTGALAFITPLVFGVLFMIAFLLDAFWLWYQYMDWADDQYIVNDEQITDLYKRPLGQEEKRVAPLKSIQSVEFERLGIIGLMLNYGTVYIRVGDVRFTFDDVYNPSEVQRDIFRRIAAQSNRERRKESEAERQRILEMLEAYHEVVKQQTPPPAAKN